MTIPATRDSQGHYLPGVSGNPSGGIQHVSIVKPLKERLAKHPEEVDELIEGWLKLAKRPDANALKELLDRIDGRVPSEVNLKALIVHIGDDYAKEGLEAIKQDLLARQERLLLTEGTPESISLDS